MKSQKILAFGAIIALLLIGSVMALDTSDGINTLEEAYELRVSQMSFGEKIAYYLSPRFKEFTTAGQARGCADQPYKDEILIISGKLCEEGDLVNVFRGVNYEVFLEEKIGGSWQWIDPFNVIRYQCYACPDLSPCTSSNAGAKTCWTATTFKICDGNNWVEERCASGSECGGRDAVCSAQNVGAICGDGNCAPGEKDTCPGDCLSDDGVTPTAMPHCRDGICSSFELSSGTCPDDCGISQTTETTDVTTGGTTSAGEAANTPCSWDVVISGIRFPAVVKPGQDVTVSAVFTSSADKDCVLNAESGIYIKKYGEQQGLLAITSKPIDSCGGVLFKEGFNDAKQLTIPASESGRVEFNFKAPTGTSLFGSNAGEWKLKKNWDGYGDNYYVIVGTFEECGGGYKAWETRSVTISKSGSLTEECGNGEIDEKENCYTCEDDAGCGFGESCVPVKSSETLGGNILRWLTRIEWTTDYTCRATAFELLSTTSLLIIGAFILGGVYLYFKFK